MSDATLHPSYLELDRHVLGASSGVATANHLADCARCRAYVASHQPTGAVPAWLEERAALSVRTPGKTVPRTRPRRLWTVGALALAAAVSLAILRPKDVDPSYDGVKGAPAVGVYVQHEGVSGLWDGAPLVAGDRIRLQIMPEEFSHVSVFNVATQEAVPKLLYTGRLPPRTLSMLPKAWELDAAPGAEQIAVMLSRWEISPLAAQELLRAHDPGEVWVVRLNFPKRGAAK
ncbi:MAG: hypothetical protein QM778_28810 [Myxococcales bacterium]